MQKVDSIKCVICGKTEYEASKGKSSRSLQGVCLEHMSQLGGMMEVPDGAQTTIPESESKGVPKGNKN